MVLPVGRGFVTLSFSLYVGELIIFVTCLFCDFKFGLLFGVNLNLLIKLWAIIKHLKVDIILNLL